MLVDGHVHIHPCFDIQVLLNSALANFQKLNFPSGPYILVLTESQSQNYFFRFKQLAHGCCADGYEDKALDLGKWSMTPTDEPDSVCAQKGNPNSSAKSLYLIAGRQIVTREKLEVLALGTTQPFPDGEPIKETVNAVLENGAIPVLPWGFGKWMGRRGEKLSKLLQLPIPGLFLADNSARPSFWPEPALFNLAKQQRFSVLNGSDPLPFKSEVQRPGRAGFSITGFFNPAHPSASLRQALRCSDRCPQVYGPRERTLRFLRNQVAMQFIKHFS